MRKFISLFAAMLMVLTASAKTWPITPTQCHEGTRDDGYTLYVELARGAQNGDTIMLMEDGEYLENQSLPVNNNVVIMAAEGKKPVVVMNGYFQVKASLIVEGITFKCKEGGQGYCFYFYENTPKFLKMENCEFKEFTQYIASSWEKYHIDSCIVEDCYFHDLAKAPFYFSKSTLPNDTNACDNLTVKNSTFANITLSEVAVLDLRNNNNNTQATSKMRVDHCTFYNCKGYERMIQSYKSPDVEVCNCIMMNPLAEGEEESIYATYLYGGSVHHNLNYQTKRQYGSGVTVTDSICRDPQFVDAANADYTLAATSPALKAGSDGSNLGDPRWFPKAAALETPDAAPAAPTWPANQVKAVYSATYEADCNFGEWSSGTAYTQDTYGKKYVTTNSGYFGLEFKEHLNCSKMEKLHLDVWVAADASMRIVPIWGGAEQGITKSLTGQQWNSVEIALSEFNQVTNWADVYQIKIDNAKNLTFWLNNVYFYTTQAPAVDETAPADVKAVVESASYFSVKIKASATDASDAVKLTVKNGEAEVASINAVSGADAILTVNNLKPNTDYNFSVIASDESGNTAEPVAVAAKTIVAPVADAAPKTYKGLVKSIYSDKYAAAPASIGTLVAGWWEPTELSQGEIAQGDNALFYAPKATGMFGWEFAETNMTGFPYLHISIYPLADGKIKIFPVVNGSTDDYVNIPDVKGGEWNHLVFDFSGKDLTKVFQIGWQDYYTLNGFFVDNVYFSQEKEDVAGADRRINAYGLNVVADGNNYTFSYIANIDGTEANLIFYQNGEEKDAVAIAAPKKGLNQATITKSDIPKGSNTWAVELKADQVFEFGKVYESPSAYNRLHVAVDNSPESDYFQRIYMSNNGAVGKGLFILNQDYSAVNAEVLTAGLTWGSPCRLDVDAYGKVWISDWADGDAAGVWILDPANTASVSQFFDFATKTSTGQYKNAEGVEIGEGCPAVGVAGEGADMIVYTAGEEGGTTLKNNGLNIYNVGQPDGSVLYKWGQAPSVIADIQNNANGNNSYGATSHGVFMGQNRSAGQNNATAYAAMFYDKTGTQRWNSNTDNYPEINGCNGGGLGVSWDEKRLGMIDASGNALIYDIAWTEDVPSLTLAGKYAVANTFAGQVDFDYAGNLLMTLGPSYGASAMAGKLYIYGLPTENNEVIVPAKKALVVEGTNEVTAIEDNIAPAKVEKVILNGQVLIIRDGKAYNMMGQIVR